MRFLRDLCWRLFSSKRCYLEAMAAMTHYAREDYALEEAIAKTYGKAEAREMRRYAHKLRLDRGR